MTRLFRTPLTRAGRTVLVIAALGGAVALVALAVPVHVAVADGRSYSCGPPLFAWPGGASRWHRDSVVILEELAVATPADPAVVPSPTTSYLTPATACPPEVYERWTIGGIVVVLALAPLVVWAARGLIEAANLLWELRNDPDRVSDSGAPR